ncbi:MAG: hypothetical protein QM497_05810 [Sulfurimonas sp.]
MDNLDYMLIVGFVIVFFIGIFFGVQLIKFFSSEIAYKIEHSFEEQLEISQDFYKNSQKKLILKIDERIDLIEQINAVLAKTKDLLSKNKQGIEKLNNACDVRENLESEIIKLKKIIQRLEKKR